MADSAAKTVQVVVVAFNSAWVRVTVDGKVEFVTKGPKSRTFVQIVGA